MRLSLRALALIILSFGWISTAWSQTAGPYLTGATLYISVGDSTDIWLNGQKLVSQDPILSASRGYVTVKLEGDQLCWFQKKNILALEIENGLEDHTVQNDNDKVGIAYVLQLEFSDNKKLVLSSSEENQHLFYKTDDQPDSDPSGWKDMGFDDGSWATAQLVPPSSEITQILHDPKTGKTVQYLYAFDVVNLKAHHGERRLFRRKFALDIVPAPPCPQPQPTSTPIPKSKPPQPTATRTATPLPIPTATPIPTWTPRPRPTRTPTPVPYIKPVPTSTPKVVHRRKPILVPTATSFILPTNTSTPIRRMKPKPTATPWLTATPTFTQEPARAAALPETIVFVNPPVNIDVDFADGPGEYKLEITDGLGNHLVTLYDKHISYESETWISWDGTNEQGRLMPVGHYYAHFSKDGKLLRQIVLDWIKTQN